MTGRRLQSALYCSASYLLPFSTFQCHSEGKVLGRFKTDHTQAQIDRDFIHIGLHRFHTASQANLCIGPIQCRHLRDRNSGNCGKEERRTKCQPHNWNARPASFRCTAVRLVFDFRQRLHIVSPRASGRSDARIIIVLAMAPKAELCLARLGKTRILERQQARVRVTIMRRRQTGGCCVEPCSRPC